MLDAIPLSRSETVPPASASTGLELAVEDRFAAILATRLGDALADPMPEEALGTLVPSGQDPASPGKPLPAPVPGGSMPAAGLPGVRAVVSREGPSGTGEPEPPVPGRPGSGFLVSPLAAGAAAPVDGEGLADVEVDLDVGTGQGGGARGAGAAGVGAAALAAFADPPGPEGFAAVLGGVSGRPEPLPPLGSRAPVHPPVSVPVETPLGSSRFGEALGDRVSWLARDGIQHAELRLNPPHLGPVEVRIRIDEAQARVVFTAHHELAREALEQSLPRLRDSFGEDGIELVQAEVSSGQRGGGRGADGQEPPGGPSDAGDPAPTPDGPGLARSPRGLIDDYV